MILWKRQDAGKESARRAAAETSPLAGSTGQELATGVGLASFLRSLLFFLFVPQELLHSLLKMPDTFLVSPQ